MRCAVCKASDYLEANVNEGDFGSRPTNIKVASEYSHLSASQKGPKPIEKVWNFQLLEMCKVHFF